ncbi:LOW QUALITY PROTEIN: uncharacterized protein LOC111075645 [Drosophila obscura]|uniref:LOW QUALITY PROTEIN: uncharacterized protein LOC111075645 n=1 Tax=Drosophila obscura TaxID=7282 RepID=UPI001BB16E0F|nr:LOW QUALITY PROTEIN: uncharacterized protein LOC111075645 [Drosophila obscura]
MQVPTENRSEASCRLVVLLVLAAGLSMAKAMDTWQRLPSLATFSSYEDMQRYFDQRNLRSMRHIDNPSDDSYLAAFNQYNEQQSEDRSGQLQHSRTKREERRLPSAPRMLRFEISDAVEPSDEVKQLLRQHYARALKETPTTESAPPAITTKATKSQRSKRKPRRQRRSIIGEQQQQQQPADFKALMIPFQETDAREPDPITAQLIREARILDLQSQSTRTEPLRKSQAPQKHGFQVRIRKTKRTKRSAPGSSPHMFKFELADAKAALPQALAQRSGKQLPATPTLLTMETPRAERSNITQSQSQSQPQNPTKATPTSTARVDDNAILSGESTAETKRMYVYKEAPPSSGHGKSKKSLSGLPHEVQKAISQLLKEGHGGKAYIKYLPAQKSEYEHYKIKPLSALSGYGLKPSSYMKYIPGTVQTKLVEASPLPVPVPVPVPVPAPVQVHIQPVPVVEQLRYIHYKPHYAQVYAAQPSNIAQHPIVVQEALPQAEEVVHHHTYTAELAPAPAPTQSIDVSIGPQFRPSKPDPLQEEYHHAEENMPIYGKALEPYQYQIQHEPSPSASPLIKIEYHAQADSIKEHYKQLPEFQQLSTLIGKSPDDQIHGLTYLLAKEMQAKLQRQGKQLMVDRPQDSTAPILFHPGQVQAPAPVPTLKTLADLGGGSLGVHQGRLIGMAKTKQYVPIIESGNNDVKELLPAVPSSVAPKLPTPSSFIDYTPGHGLSHGYEGVRDDEQQPVTTVEHVVHHPTVTNYHHQQQQQQQQPQQHHYQGGGGLVATSLPAELDAAKGANGLHFVSSQEDKSLQQYASKYAFGYRIRDFHTGNDFGHKQNRDFHGVTRGQYHILLPDGRIQNVIYHADDTGFHADVSFEGGAKH